MIKNICISAIFLTGLLISSCANKAARSARAESANRDFELPVVPPALNSPSERASFLVTHYWDKTELSDSVLYTGGKKMEQALVNYIDLLSQVDPSTSESSIHTLLSRAEAASSALPYKWLKNQLAKYLHDPLSPLRNDELYINVAEYITNDERSDEADTYRAESDLAMMMKNRPGERANNFSFTLAGGKSRTLYEVHSQLILLMFYNPDCHACKEATQVLKSSELLDTLIRKDLVKVLAVYPDEDASAWRRHIPGIPETWINGIDAQHALREKELYDLRAMPTLYLLDKDKQVILKDADPGRCLSKLAELF